MSRHKSEGPAPGEIGYRTRDGRSGLDPLENQYELARVEGHFIRKLLTGKLHFRSTFYIYLSAAIGLICIAIPLISIMANNGELPGSSSGFVCGTLLLWVPGIFFLFNVVTSIRYKRQLSQLPHGKVHQER